MSGKPTASALGGSLNTHYTVKKRRRPQTKKEKNAGKPGVETKSNPSKRHRDRLNQELDNLAQLIPFPYDVINKLDKLSILRLAVSYLRNKSYHNTLNTSDSLPQFNPSDVYNNQLPLDFKVSLEALNGFIVVVNESNNIFYVSETIQDLLGFPQCDVMNTSMLDLIHADDREIFKRNMKIDPKDTRLFGSIGQMSSVQSNKNFSDNNFQTQYEKLGIPSEIFQNLSNKGMMHRSFICRLRCLIDNSSGFLALHFTGHIRLLHGQNKQKSVEKIGSKVTCKDNQTQPETAIFLLATPLESPSILEIRTKNFIFRTKHKLNYTPLSIDAKGRVVLGYTEHQLRQRSGYEFIHSADMMHCADAHTKLMKHGESGMTVFRILHKENKWLWVTASSKIVMRHGRPEYIVSTHRPIPDEEGLDHLRKRSVQFRFDFTGQAVLYGEVNPIGTKPQQPPNQNIQHKPQSKKNISSIKKQNPLELATNRTSLFEAQAMQSGDIYEDQDQNHKNEIFDDIYESVIGGRMPLDPGNKDLITLESNDFGTYFYKIDPPQVNIDLFENDYLTPPLIEHQPMQISADMPMQVPPIDNSMYQSSSINLSYLPNNQPVSKNLKRPYPYNDRFAVPAGIGGKKFPPTRQQTSYNYQMGSNVSSQRCSTMNLKNSIRSNFKSEHPPWDRKPSATISHYPTDMPVQQSYKQSPHQQSIFHQHPQQTASYSDGFYTGNQQNPSFIQEISGEFPNLSPPDKDWNDVDMVAYQESTTKLDLQEIAVKFQTTDPMQKAEEYLNAKDAATHYSNVNKDVIIAKNKFEATNQQYVGGSSNQQLTYNTTSYNQSNNSSPAMMSISPYSSNNNYTSDYSSEWEAPSSNTNNNLVPTTMSAEQNNFL